MPRLSKIGAAALAAFGWTGLSSVTASYLVVAGGGGGGYSIGGGGGAGGYRTGTSSLNPTLSYTVTVGAGGSGGVSGSSAGSNGTDSVFNAITSTGGGGGGGNTDINGKNGGSGGGSTVSATAGNGNTPSTSPSQGNNGGTAANALPYSSAGGGGASAVGVNANPGTGNGGAGSSSSISGSSVTYAGGGGGGRGLESSNGTGGLGGGGNGGISANGSPGTANTGGGGGGGGNGVYTGGSGGSGVVIISYVGAQQFGGGVVTSVGGNTIHTFTTSGTLSPLSSLTANFLVVGGGGSGGGFTGGFGGGGGGAGGLRSSVTNTGGGGSLESALTLDTNSIYTVTVGAGGAAIVASIGIGNNGSDSSFSSITSTGGGGGATSGGNGATGGSGGGAGARSGTGTGTGGSGTANQGYAGGVAFAYATDSTIQSGGGGGAGAVGGNATSTVAGNGGNGVASSISGSSVTYAGGGGGSTFQETLGSGGTGGGGAGAKFTTSTAAVSGSANTGGGGGGGNVAGGSSGAGGSGVVIISYPGSTQQMAGGTVTVAGGNVIHTFTSSGYLTPIVLVNNSLRFRSSAGAYLNRTPATTTNRRTWTWSGWVKRGTLGTNQSLFTCYFANNDTSYLTISFTSDNLNIGLWNTSILYTSAVYRDPSAWYHIVLAIDTTQATASDRAKLYVNGTQVTAFGSTGYPAQNTDLAVNSAAAHYISTYDGTNYKFDGYMADINFVDGQALTPNSFGTFNGLGVWQPIRYGGSYGTNGFYLPFTNNAVTANYLVVAGGGGGGDDRGGGGGAGGLRSTVTATGGGGSLESAITLNAGNSYTVTVGAGGAGSVGGAKGSNGVNSSISGSGITTVTSTGGGGGGGNGGSTIPNGNSGGSGGGARNNASATGGAGTANQGYAGGNNSTNDGAAGAGGGGAGAVGKDGSPETVNRGNGGAGVAVSITGSSVTYAGGGGGGGEISNNGGAGGTGGGGAGAVPSSAVAGTANTGGGGGGGGYTTSTQPAAGGGSGVVIISYAGSAKFTGGTITSSGGNTIHTFTSSGTLVGNIAADYSPNGNNWTPNNISLTSGVTYDSMTDVPTLTSATTANYCVLNSLNQNSAITLSAGNLSFTASNNRFTTGTFAVTSGKWYWEFYPVAGGASGVGVGAILATTYVFGTAGFANGAGYTGVGYTSNGSKYISGTSSAYGATYGSGNVIGVALDLDSGTKTITFYKDNTSQGSINLPTSSEAWIVATDYAEAGTHSINFGQQPFAYTPPTGFNRLNTFNLPTPTIGATASTTANKYFNANLYTGNAGSNTISGVGFQPDFIWAKSRSNGAAYHGLWDVVRGSNNLLYSNGTDAEANAGNLNMSPNADGFSINGGNSSFNLNTSSQVAWNWKANGTGVTNTAGSITSTVSANTTAGFSIVTYTGNSTNGATVGHGLGVAPSLMFVKVRNATARWVVYQKDVITANNQFLELNSTTGVDTSGTNFWTISSINSTTFGLGTNGDTNGSTLNFVAYCFAPVAGYSAFGTYTGNGSTDGSFIYTGFRPSFVLIKSSSSAGTNWELVDYQRGYNGSIGVLLPNDSGAEFSGNYVNLLSNGFKLVTTSTAFNGSGSTYIYAAFAENPFKYANAR